MMTSIRENKFLRGLLSLSFWILLWYFAAMKVGKELILPSPFAVISRLSELIVIGEFWQSAFTTILRILSGYVAGICLAVILAVGTCSSPLLDALFSPVIKIVRATPVASFIILALLWMGKSRVPGLMAMLMVVPVVWENISAQYRATDEKLLEMAAAYRLTSWQKFRFIYVPSALPGLVSGCVTSMGLAWKSGIAAEVLSQPSIAIGTKLYYSKIYLETADLFAWTMVVIILSLCIEKVIRILIMGGRKDENQ